MDFKKIKKSVIDAGLMLNESMAKETQWKTKEIQKAVEKKAKSQNKTISDEVYDKIYENQDAADEWLASATELKHMYHSNYSKEDNEYEEEITDSIIQNEKTKEDLLLEKTEVYINLNSKLESKKRKIYEFQNEIES